MMIKQIKANLELIYRVGQADGYEESVSTTQLKPHPNRIEKQLKRKEAGN
jgi:hypothetical protein